MAVQAMKRIDLLKYFFNLDFFTLDEDILKRSYSFLRKRKEPVI
jgi:hypothetical protein